MYNVEFIIQMCYLHFFQEMEQLNNFTNYNMPEMSEVITSFLSGGEKQKSKAVKAAKKRQ